VKQFKLDKAVKKAWIQALESGKYKKGAGKLSSNNQYCCLGVLAEELGILKEHNNIKGMKGCCLKLDISKPISKEDISHSVTGGYLICDEILPPSVQLDLADINDDSNTFEPVIDYIRKNL